MPATKFRVLDGGTIDLYSTNLKTAPSGTIYADGSAVRIAGTGSHVLVGSGHNLLFAGPTHTIGGASATIFNIGVSGDTINMNTAGVNYNIGNSNSIINGSTITIGGNIVGSATSRYGGKSFSVNVNLTDLTNDAPWYGVGMSSTTNGTAGQTLVQYAGYYGIQFAVSGKTIKIDQSGNISGAGTINGATISGGTLSGGSVTGGTWDATKSAYLNQAVLTTSNVQFANGTFTGTMSIAGDISGNSKVAIRTNDAWLRLNADSGFTSGTYTPLGLRADGGLAAGSYTLTAGEVRGDIFRAGNSASYYLDPDNTTTSLAIAGPITVGGYQLEFLQSNRDFVNGTLITTDINYAVSGGDAWYMEIKGNSYGSSIPFDIKVQGYIYSDSIINRGGISNGTTLTGLVALNSGGKLCFWFPRQDYWQGFSVYVNDSFAGRSRNRVVSITDVVKPAGATKEVAITLTQSLHTGNHGSGSHIPSGGSSGQVLKWSSDGVATWGTDNDTVYTHPSVNHIPTGGATGNILQWSSSGTAAWKANGTSGQYLSYDGSWATPPDTNTWRPIDDTPVNGSTTTSISSNWAYDHDADPSAHHSNAAIVASDTRSTNHAPQDRPAGLTVDFRANTTDSLADGGSYHGVMSFRTYSTGADFSGGPAHQLAFTENGNLFIRKSTSATTWGSWVGLAKLSGADFTGTVSTTNKRLVFRDDSIEHHADDNDTAGVAINYYGYNGGTGRFRNFTVYDGKGAAAFTITGSNKTALFGSSVTTTGNVFINGGNLNLSMTAGETKTQIISYNNASSLWILQGTTTSVLLAAAHDWDQQAAIQYSYAAPAASPTGVMRIGQLQKNHATYWAHGATELWAGGASRLTVGTGGITVAGTMNISDNIMITKIAAPELAIGNGSSTTPVLKLKSTGVEGWLWWMDGSDRFEFKNSSGTYSPIYAQEVLTRDTVVVNAAGSGTTGGLSLYDSPASVGIYGIAFRYTSNQGTHGDVTGDWATYFFMEGTAGRGWIFKNASTGTGVASISNTGKATFNGPLKIQSNVSGVSQGLYLQDPGGGAGEGLFIQWGTGDQGEIIRMGLSTVAAGYGDWYLDMRPNASTTPQRNLTVTASGAVKPRYLVLPVGADAYAT